MWGDPDASLDWIQERLALPRQAQQVWSDLNSRNWSCEWAEWVLSQGWDHTRNNLHDRCLYHLLPHDHDHTHAPSCAALITVLRQRAQNMQTTFSHHKITTILKQTYEQTQKCGLQEPFQFIFCRLLLNHFKQQLNIGIVAETWNFFFRIEFETHFWTANWECS